MDGSLPLRSTTCFGNRVAIMAEGKRSHEALLDCVIRLVFSYLLIKLGVDTGWWLVAGLGLLVGSYALSEFFQRFFRAV